MTSRRPMARSFSANGRTSSFSSNGRTSSFNEEESSSSNGRNTYLSNVRPETRSTLCSVMAQLTEDIQPTFETTLKSKAVSENCNVKFTCVVSGYPAPEMKWYKDDMQMDRFCGLPKYEIRCNGKTHTLHIYNCTMDDAAIYQVSASNSKGIVSCSGVLEVGDMNEYKIHQRFFSKLKQKAEKKKTDLLESQTKKEVKESTQKEKPRVSPERPPRKRHVPLPEERPVVKDPESMEQLGAAAEPNNETAPMTSKDSGLETEISPDEKNLAAKKIKISNDVDSSSRSHVMGNGGENCYDGGFSLAQFLSETLQSQAADDKQNSPQGEKPKEMDVHIADFSIEQEREQERIQKEKEKQVKALEEEYKREKKREEELAIEREQERQLEISHKVPAMKHGSGAKQHSKAHKDHDHHVIQASISTMLHTVKDFLFGKSKKDSHDHNEKKERESDHSPSSTQPPKPETPPSFRLQRDHNKSRKSLTEDVVPMEVDKLKELSETVDIKQQSVSLQPHEHKCEDSILHKDLSSAPKLPPESIEESTGQCKEADKAVEAMEGSVGPKGSGPEEEMSLPGLQGLNEAEQKYSQKDSFIKENPVHQQEPNHLVVSPERSHLAAKEECSPTHISVLPQTEAPKEEEYSSTLTRWNESWTPTHSSISASNSHSLGEAPTETLQEEGISVDKMGKVGEPHTDEGLPSTKLCEEEKTEVKSNQQPLSDINRSEMAELTASTVEEIIETCKSKTPDQVVAPPSAMAACSVEGEKVEEKIERASLIQEMKVGFPPTVAPGSLDKGDLKIQQECTSSIAVERTEVKYLSEGRSSNKGSRSGEEKSELKEVMIYSLEKDLGVNSSSNLQTKEQVISESEHTEPRNDCLPFKVETEKKDTMKLDELDKSKSLSVTQNNECNANVKEQSTFADKNNRERQQGWPSENTPQIQVSTFVDTPDIKPTTPDVNPNEHFIIPKIEIMEPEFKQCILPPKSLPLNKQESELAILQNHDSNRVSEVINKNQSVVDSPSLLPKQTDVKKDYHPSPTQRVQDVAQLNDEPEVFEREQTSVKSSSEQLPQMDFASIPVINVSFTDDKEGDICANNHFSDTQQPFETPGVPLFVVPPISVTCHESDAALPLSSQSELTETVTSAATQRETKHDVDNNMTPKPEKAPRKKHNPDKMADKSIQEALIPKVGDNVPSLNITSEVNISPEILKTKPLTEAKVEDSVSVVEDIQRNKSSPERLCCKPPTHPSLSPASLRRFMAKAAADSDSTDKADDDLSGGSTPTSSLSRESSPRLKRRDSLTLIRSATPEELASGARRKIFMLKPKEDVDAAAVGAPDTQVKKESPYMSPSQARRAALLQTPTGQNTPPLERRSPLLGRRKNTLEVPKVAEVVQPAEEPASTKKEEKPEKKLDPLKAPQVIRKIRGEPFPDASGHLKLWCQFFNVLSDSTIKWYRDEEEILEVKRSGGDESQVALAIVLACSQDCGVYGCTISNEYGTDTTDFLLSVDILSNTLLKDDLEVQEEIEMTPMLFAKGLGDSGNWGEKFFGRIMTDTVHLGDGCAHKASRVKVIYGLDPVFDSGSCCIIKIQNPIPYGTKQESNLTERNLAVTKQECKVQNMIREYCKIFAAEARLVENFGYSLEVIPQYLMYRPANTVPYGTVEAELKGVFLKYCMMDPKGRLITRSTSEVEQKCGTFQHWIHQWTHGNLLVTRLDGVETKITNVRVVTKSKGYQGLTEYGSPEVFEQFLTHHQCNYYCGLLGLPPLKTMDSQPSKIKGSRSPLLNRKLGSSPQLQRKGTSPQMTRKASSSPKVPKKVQESEDNQSGTQLKPAETVNVLEVR